MCKEIMTAVAMTACAVVALSCAAAPSEQTTEKVASSPGNTAKTSKGEKMLTLVQDGKARARIVVGGDVAPSAKFAAKELQTYVQKATGATLPMAESLRDDGIVEIVVGDGKISRSLGVNAKGLGRDAFRIKTIGKRIVILGRDDPRANVESRLKTLGSSTTHYEHATLFGVYEFLERFMGVRWYLPIDIGEIVPKTKTLSIPIVNITEGPNKIGRYIHIMYGADDKDDPPPKTTRGGYWPGFTGREKTAFNRRRGLWFLRLRHQTQYMSGAPHTMPILISPKQYSKSNPEFFALTKDGKRNYSHHCYTNPGMIKTLIGHAEACFGGKPASSRGLANWGSMRFDCISGKAFHIAPSDGYVPCFCKTCQAFRASLGPNVDPEGELVWSAMIKVANAVGKTFPDCYISVHAYGPLGSPPKRKVPRNIFVGPIGASGPYSEFKSDHRRMELERIAAWNKAITKKQYGGFYHYPLWGGWENGRYFWDKSICGSVPRAFASCYKRYADIGLGTYCYLMSHRIAYDHLNIYMFYKYHWNPHRDVDALLNEYYTLFYGPAAPQMKNFWEEVETKFRDVLQLNKTTSGSWPSVRNPADIWEKVYTRQVITRWQGYFTEAARLAEKDNDPIYSKRVAYMKRNVLDSIEEGLIQHEKSRQ